MGVCPIDDEPRWQRASQRAQACEGSFAAVVASDDEASVILNENLVVVAVLQIERFDDGDRQSYREAVAPS
jgi:hypothetical protein